MSQRFVRKAPARRHSRGYVERRQLYARYGVPYAWIVDPRERTLEAHALRGGAGEPLAAYGAADEVSVAPFAEAVFRVGALWE